MLKFEEAIACIRREINFLRSQNKRPLEENKELKNEHYKDEELSKMKDRKIGSIICTKNIVKDSL